MFRGTFAVGLLLLLVVSLTACSSANNFVIVNASTSELEVRYRIKRSSEMPVTMPLLPFRPGVLREEQLDEQIPWRALSDSEFEYDTQAHYVTVKLMPGYALRVAQLNLRDDANQELPIEELFLNGASGQTHLQGRAVQKSFTPGHTYLLRYQ